MGYSTQYNLKILNSKSIKPIENLVTFSDGARDAIDIFGKRYNATKWYDSRDDMIKLSIIYPKYLFQLKGIGEEKGDTWKEYYKNGHCDSRKMNVIFK